ncbi:MAG: PIN domain nuclease [Rhodoglobus sp.]
MTLYLADKSAYEQQRYSTEADVTMTALVRESQLATCDVVALELLYSTRGPADYAIRERGLRTLAWLPMGAEVGRVALDIQRKLVRKGQHRRPIMDLMIAATALVHDAVVLHYDRDFDLIAAETGQPSLWIVPRGTGHGAAQPIV